MRLGEEEEVRGMNCKEEVQKKRREEDGRMRKGKHFVQGNQAGDTFYIYLFFIG